MLLKNATPSDLLGKNIKFNCECFIKNIIGRVVDIERFKDEVIYVIDTNKKIIRIGSNHPGMTFECID